RLNELNDALDYSPNVPQPMSPDYQMPNSINTQPPIMNNQYPKTPISQRTPTPSVNSHISNQISPNEENTNNNSNQIPTQNFSDQNSNDQNSNRNPLANAPPQVSLDISQPQLSLSQPVPNQMERQEMPPSDSLGPMLNNQFPREVNPNFGAFGNPYVADSAFSSHPPDGSLIRGDRNFQTTLSSRNLDNSLLPFKKSLIQSNYNFNIPRAFGKKIKSFVIPEEDYNELPKYPPLNNSCTYGNLSQLRFSPYGPALYCPPKLAHGIEQNIIKNYSEIENVITRIETKLNMPVKLNLLYRASISGDRSDAFHNRCDFFDCTLVIIETIQGNRFGGFTTRNWNGNLVRKMDPNAFVYSIDRKMTYNVKPNELATGCYPNCGPVFLGCQIRVLDHFFS
ncbi:MAG: hypothetical protein HUJ61_00635, partial [Bacilli bacterium]|nr:hypothetical protein [Bacilli bacterium]